MEVICIIEFTNEFMEELEQMEWEAELSQLIHDGMKEYTDRIEVAEVQKKYFDQRNKVVDNK